MNKQDDNKNVAEALGVWTIDDNFTPLSVGQAKTLMNGESLHTNQEYVIEANRKLAKIFGHPFYNSIFDLFRSQFKRKDTTEQYVSAIRAVGELQAPINAPFTNIMKYTLGIKDDVPTYTREEMIKITMRNSLASSETEAENFVDTLLSRFLYRGGVEHWFEDEASYFLKDTISSTQRAAFMEIRKEGKEPRYAPVVLRDSHCVY